MTHNKPIKVILQQMVIVHVVMPRSPIGEDQDSSGLIFIFDFEIVKFHIKTLFIKQLF